MTPISGGRINLYQKNEENFFSTLSKIDYARNIPRNTAAVDTFSINQRAQLAQERRLQENNSGIRGWLNEEHVGEFNGKPFVYRNFDVVLPAVCIIAIGLAIYFL
jgi:hypothetical protein